jgi:NADH-quinone oxidoreductase subunit C
MADDPENPPSPPEPGAASASSAEAAAEGGAAKAATPPTAASDKPASAAPAEPLKGEVSRTDAPAAGASAAPVALPRQEPPAPTPANPAAATTAVTSETSSATGQPTAPAQPAAASQPAPPRPAPPAAAKPAAAPGEAHAPKAAAPTGPPDPPPPADKTPPAFIQTLQLRVPGSVAQISYWVGDWTIIVPLARLVDVARHLRDAPDALFDFCSDVTASDWPPRAERFDVIYCLYSTVHRHRIRVKARASELQPVPSMADIWPAANWLEREVYDMFGVNFAGHPDRRRILMPDDWQGFPQRKDYPLEGPGELLMENPLDWLKLRQARDEVDIE